MFLPLKNFAVIGSLLCSTAIFLLAQNPAEMPMRQVISGAQELIGAGDYGQQPLTWINSKFDLPMKITQKWRKFSNNSDLLGA